MKAVDTGYDRVGAMATARGLFLCESPGPVFQICRNEGPGPEPCTFMVRVLYGPATLAECERWLDS